MEKSIIPEKKRYGIFLSGGLDSAVLFFIMAHTFKNSEFVLFTGTRDDDGEFNKIPAKKVAEFVKNRTKCCIVSHEIMKFENRTDARANRYKKMTTIIDQYKIEACCNGFTANPNDPELLNDNTRDQRRDSGGELVKLYYNSVLLYQPFANKDKRYIISLIKKFNLEEFLDITVSCESNTPPRPCGKCWWCKEREWALE